MSMMYGVLCGTQVKEHDRYLSVVEDVLDHVGARLLVAVAARKGGSAGARAAQVACSAGPSSYPAAP